MGRLLWFVVAIGLASSAAWACKGLPSFQVRASAHGSILTDANGMTLYTFDGDARYRPNCATECTNLWRPFVVAAGFGGNGYWTPITRPDNIIQWAYGGRPLYTFRGDLLPGDVKGERYDNGRWHAARVLCMPTDEEGRLIESPVIEVLDAALENGNAPLRDLRRWCGVDMGELAERSGTSIAAIEAHENGRGDMSLREIAAIANALGVPVYLLLE